MEGRGSFMSKRNKEKFAHEGHLYNFERLDRGKKIKFWRCDKRCSFECKARLHTQMDTGEVIKQVNEHNHDGNAVEVEFAALRNALKRRADETQESPAAIVREICEEASPAVRAHLPNHAAMREMVRRRRRPPKPKIPLLPADRASLVIPESYQTCRDGDRFLLFDSGQGDEERIIIFGRQSYGSWSSFMKNIVADGAFKIAPPPFGQVYVIMAERGGFILPVLYALLPNDQERTYAKMFASIKEVWPQFSPETITVDFEETAFSALKASFPDAQICGCFFLLVKSLKKSLAQHGLLSKYNNECEFALSARMIASLAFVPIESLDNVLSDLSMELPEELLPILRWFEATYIGSPNQFGGRQEPRFPPTMWSVYRRALMGEDQTSNRVEGVHREMRLHFGTNEPSIWNFIDGIRKVQVNTDMQYEFYIRGDKPPQRRAKYVRASNRIVRMMPHFGRQPNVDYLRGIAICFLMN